jgi:hypothetical protein
VFKEKKKLTWMGRIDRMKTEAESRFRVTDFKSHLESEI